MQLWKGFISDNPTINSSLVRYNYYCNHKPYGTSKPTFSSPKGYLPSITSISKIQSILQQLLIILLTTTLPMEKPQLSVVSKHPTSPAPLTAPPCHRRDPGTCNPDSLLRGRLSRRTCPVFFFREKPRSPSVLSTKHRPPIKSRRPPRTFSFLASLNGSIRGSSHKSLTSGRARRRRR